MTIRFVTTRKRRSTAATHEVDGYFDEQDYANYSDC